MPIKNLMKIKPTSLYALLLCALLLPGTARAAVVDDRLNARLDAYINNPSEDPNSPDPGIWTWGQAGVALATFKRFPAAGNLTTARTYVDNLCNLQNPLPADPSAATIYFKLPMLVRMYLDPAMNANLTQTNKDNIERVMWQFTKGTSKLTDANASVWRVFDSENHDAIRKTTWMLSLQILKQAGAPYGGSAVLDDGNTVDTHLVAWKQYFFEFFRQRTREGLNCEIASRIYAKYTLGAWLNVCDLSEDANLRTIANDAITLFWADYGGDFCTATGLRTTSGSRWYKDDLDSGSDALRDITYCYDMHDNSQGLHPYNVNAASSPYRPPTIVQMIAGDPNRAPFLNTTRRFGKGGAWVNEIYTVTFDANHASNLRRDNYWHPDFVIGSLTLKTDSNAYISLVDQNRVMGVIFAKHKEDRIVFHGKGTDDGGRKGFAEISGICGTRCLVATWDKNATFNAGIRLFVSDGALQTNKVDDTGWIFTKTGGSPFSAAGTESYVGIRISNGTYTQTNTTGGVMLDLSDKTAPVIIEVNSGTNFTAFKNACKSNAFNFTAGKLTYTSSAGDTYEMWANSGNLPKKNGTNVNLNPSKTYNGPYLTGDHGSDQMTVMYPGQPNLNLDFNYKDSPRWDDYQTKGLWHMDAATGGVVLDDDRYNTTRNGDLTLTGGASIVAGGKFGNALSLNGTTGYGHAAYNATGPKGWAAYPTVKIDLWFKLTDFASAASQTVANAPSIWEFRAAQNGASGDLNFFVWDNQTPGGIATATVPGGASPGVWHHATGTVDASGNVTLKVDNLTPVTASTGFPMKINNTSITVGWKSGTTRYFKGLIDDMKVRIYNLQ
jgi:hypothetical protein